MLDIQGIEGLIGRTFQGCRVTSFIARGGMGLVFEGIQESLGRRVAIKFLYPHLSSQTFQERFEREARVIAQFNHPNVVRIIDYGSNGPLHYFIMDLIDGESLRERLAACHAKGETFDIPAILNIVEPVGSALTYAHRLGYVHRDIKPGNILLDHDDRAYLSDFGVVKAVGEQPMTATGAVVGTPEYMAPEQGSGEKEVTPLADLYSLAVITYEMAVGRAPFRAQTPVAVMRMQITDPPPRPSTLVPGFPPQLEAVLMRALEKDPNDRYESVEAYLASLKAAADSAGHVALASPLTGTRTEAWDSIAPGPELVTEPEGPGPPPDRRPAGKLASMLAAVMSHRVTTLLGLAVLVITALLMLIPSPNSDVSLSQPKSQTSLHINGSPSPGAGPAGSPPAGSGAGAPTGSAEGSGAGSAVGSGSGVATAPGSSQAARPRALPVRLVQNAGRNVRFLYFVIGSATTTAVHNLLENVRRIIERISGGSSSASQPANGKVGTPPDVQAMVALSGAPPNTPCTLSYVGPNGSADNPQQLGSMTTDAQGNAIWSGNVAAPGTGTVTVDCNGTSMSGPLQIIDQGGSPLPSSPR